MSEVSGGGSGAGGDGSQAAPPRFTVSFDDPVTGAAHTLHYPPAPSPTPASSFSPSPPVTFDLGSLAASSTSLLYSLTLHNPHPSTPIHLSLSTSPPDILALQLHNENLTPHGRMLPPASIYQLLNEVDYIDSITLPPLTPTPLILVVHPHLALQQLQRGEGDRGEHPAADGLQPPPSRTHLPSPAAPSSSHPSPPPSPTHRLLSVAGSIRFLPSPCTSADACLTLPFACRVGRSVLSVSAVELDLQFDHCIPNVIYHRQVTLRNLSELPTSFYLHLHPHHDTSDDTQLSELSSHNHHHHRHRHHHHSRSHRRAADPPHLPHTSSSSSPSHAGGSSVAPPPVFEVTDVDSGKRVMIHSDATPFGTLTSSHPRQCASLSLPPFAAVRLRLSFRPPALSFPLHRTYLGEHTHHLSLTNLLDTCNTLTLTLHTVVSADRRAAGVLILPPSAKVQADWRSVSRAIAFLLNVQARDREQAIAMAKASPRALEHGGGVGGGEGEEVEGAGGSGGQGSGGGGRWGEVGRAGGEVEESELSEIQFGDCYTGCVVARLFSLHNRTGEALEVHLGASAAHAKGDITFHFLQDVYDGGRTSKPSSTTNSSGSGSAAGGREGRHRQRAAVREGKAVESAAEGVGEVAGGMGSVHPLDDEHSVHLNNAEGKLHLDLHALSPATPERRSPLPVGISPQDSVTAGGLSLSLPSRSFSPSLARIDSESNLTAAASTSSPPAQTSAHPADGLIRQLLLANERTKEEAQRLSSCSTHASSYSPSTPAKPLPTLSTNHLSPQLSSSMSPLSSSVNFAPLHLSDSPSASFIASGLSPVSLATEGRGQSEIALDLQPLTSPASATSSPPPPPTRSSHHYPSPTRGPPHASSSSPSSNPPPTSSSLSSPPASAPDARSSRVEVIVLPPGRRQDLMITYRPEVDVSRPHGRGGGGEEREGDDDRAYALQPRKFRVTFDIRSAQSSSAHGVSPASHSFSSSSHSSSSSSSFSSSSTFTKRLRATARACQSYVSLERDRFDFGDVNLGTKQAASVRLLNHSDLPAQMEVSLASQSVRVRRMALLVPARTSHDLKFDFIPRKLNALYHKDIAIANVHNTANMLQLRLTAVIIDEHKVLFHSTFYQLTSPTFPELDIRSPPLNGHHTHTNSSSSGSRPLLGSDKELTHIHSAAPMVRRSQSFGAPPVSRTPMASRGSLVVGNSGGVGGSALAVGGVGGNGVVVGGGAVTPGEDVPSALHLLHFGRMVENNPWVRVFNVTNLASSPIELQWSSSDPSELRLMQETIDQHQSPPSLTSPTSTPTPSTSTLSPIPPPSQPSPSSTLTAVTEGDEATDDASHYPHPTPPTFEPPLSFLRPSPTRASLLPPGSALSDLWLRFLHFCKEDAQHNHDDVPAASPSSASSSTAFPSLSTLLASASPPDPELLRLHCKKEINRRQDLQKVLSSELLSPLSTLHLAPYQTVRVYVVWMIGAVPRPWMSTKLRSLDAEIQIQLTRYPQHDTTPTTTTTRSSPSPSPASNEPLPPRCLPVQSLVCRSVLDVSQKHIHFGVLTSMERHEKQLVLHNQSEVPLLFALRKTGSIASSDLHFPSHSLGIVRPYGHLELPFIFKPSLAGAFNEPITLDNLQDPTNSQVVQVKAHLRKPLHFWLKHLSLDFGFAAISSSRRKTSSASSDVAAVGAAAAGGVSVAGEEGEEDEEEGDGGEHGGDEDGAGDESTLSQWVVLKNISSKPRTFKAQLRSIRLLSSRSKADIVDLAQLHSQQLDAALARQRSTESLFRSSASSSSLRSPDGEMSPSPPSPAPPPPACRCRGMGGSRTCLTATRLCPSPPPPPPCSRCPTPSSPCCVTATTRTASRRASPSR